MSDAAEPTAFRSDWYSLLQSYLALLVGTFIIATNFVLFMAPAKTAPGGVSGITIIIHHFTGWPEGLVLLVLNTPMTLLGFFYLGRFRFLTRTLFVVVLYSLGIDLLATVLPQNGITSDPLLNALFGGVVGGIGTGLIFRGRGTPAGTGVISRVIQLKTGLPVSQIYILIDGSIIAVLGWTFGWENALYALIMLFVWGLATDYVLEGPSVIRTVMIITDKDEQVSAALLERLRVGVTGWPGRGMYTDSSHTVLFCAIGRPDVAILQQVVAEADPNSFVVIGHGHQARGGVMRQAIPSLRLQRRVDQTA